MNRGTLYALAAYLLWGLFPLYWKQVTSVPGMETTAHRIVWAGVFAAVILTVRRDWSWLAPALRRPRIVLTSCLTGALLLLNWLTYIFAVNTNQIVEASLGYYICPLVNVLLAILFLRERPRPWQWAAITIAAVGVTYLTFNYGHIPWISLSLAFSFGFYGLIRKTANLGSLQGLFLEMAILTTPLAIYILSLEASGSGAMGSAPWPAPLLLVLGGAATGTPLLFFTAGARRTPLIVMGLLQYIAPTMQFILSLTVFDEPFSAEKLVGFCFIWTALAVLTLENVLERRRVALVLRAQEMAR